MRYILDDNGYVEAFGTHPITCSNKSCTAYEGDVPEGYETIEEWVQMANIRAYKVVDGQLVYDSVRDEELQALYESECKVESKSMIMVALNASKTFNNCTAWGWYHLPYDRVVTKVGSKLSLSSDGRVLYTGDKVLKVTIQVNRNSGTTAGNIYPFFNNLSEFQGAASSAVPIAHMFSFIIGAKDIKVWLAPSTTGKMVLEGHATNNYNYLIVEEL